MPRIYAFESQRSKFLKYNGLIVFILENSADPALCGISFGSSPYAQIPSYGYPE